MVEDDEDSSEGRFGGFGAEGPWSGSESEGLEDAEEQASVHVKSQRPAPSALKRLSPEPQQTNGDLASSLKTARETDRRKGKAVAKQIVRP